MSLFKSILATAVAATACAPAIHALQPKEYPDTVMIPKRAVIVTGDGTKSGP